MEVEQIIASANEKVKIAEMLYNFHVGQILNWEGFKVRVIDLIFPNDWLKYGVITVEPLERLIPARAYWIVKADRIERRIPIGWVDCAS